MYRKGNAHVARLQCIIFLEGTRRLEGFSVIVLVQNSIYYRSMLLNTSVDNATGEGNILKALFCF